MYVVSLVAYHIARNQDTVGIVSILLEYLVVIGHNIFQLLALS